MAPTLGSLFDGIGGFPLAAIRNGITPLWASEIEAFPISVTKKRFPGMLHVGDITKLNGTDLPPVDIITGGSPCQDLSVAGARAGLFGERSGLFMEQIRIVKEMRDATGRHGGTALSVRPGYMVWENVPGVFSSGIPRGEDFRTVLEETARIADSAVSIPRPPAGVWLPAGAILGDRFSVAWRVLDAQYWGVAQRRKRIFLVADFGAHTAPEILFKQDRLFGDTAPGAGTRQGIAAATETGAGSSGRTDGCLAYVRNQRDEARDPGDCAGADDGDGQAGQGYPCVLTAGFCAGAAPTAGGIGYREERAPTLKAGESGTNMVPAVLCLNDQGGRRMDIFEDQTGTLRARVDGHPPLIMEDPQGGAEDATYCIAGNIIGREPHNGGNGLGVQPGVCYSLTTSDHHAVYSRLRSDLLIPNDVAATQSDRQSKDATDLVCETHQQVVGAIGYSDHKGVNNQFVAGDKCVVEKRGFIRRLTPLECERLQGFPDFWTDVGGGSDSARYKALGNSVAIPCVEFVMRGIAYFLWKGSV